MAAARSPDAIHSAGALHGEVDALQRVMDARLRQVQLPHFLHSHTSQTLSAGPHFSARTASHTSRLGCLPLMHALQKVDQLKVVEVECGLQFLVPGKAVLPGVCPHETFGDGDHPYISRGLHCGCGGIILAAYTCEELTAAYLADAL